MAERILLNSKDAAAYLGVSYHTLKRWRDKGQGPPYKSIEGSDPLYNREELKRWALSSNNQQETDDESR